MLKARKVSYTREHKQILHEISLEIQPGKIIGILGPNGAGKSTLMQTLAGYIALDSGTITVDGNESRDTLQQVTSYMNHTLNYPDSWNAKNILKLYQAGAKDFNRQRFMGMAKSLEIDLDQPIKQMSRGQRERLQLSLTFSQEVEYYFLDEPLTGIDVITREEILRSLLVFSNPDASIIISSHYIDIFEMLFEEVYFIGDGMVTEKVDPEVIRAEGITLVDKYKELFAKGVEIFG